MTTAPLLGEDFRGTKRFLVLRRVGAGGAGVVYEAYDRDQGARVGLKVLKKLNPDALLRFKNEFRALQDVHHPNLVSLGELFEEGGRWFFTMEFVDGKDLLSYVNRHGRRAGSPTTEDRTAGDTVVDAPPAMSSQPSLASAATTRQSRHASPSSSSLLVSSPLSSPELPATPSPDVSWLPPFDEKRLRNVLPQVVLAVRALHQAGKVHRDIKASNILVTPEGRAVVLDFGLIMEARRAREEAETHMVVGTEKYMAPEQAAALQIGPQADCYSIGVVLYRALTGQFPFGEATGDSLLARQRHKPLPPMTFVEGVPSDLNELCLDLLRTSPELRPTCDQILERLNATNPTSITGESLVPSSLASGGGPFIGREVELAILHDAFDETLRGSTATIAVIGESGVGKSTLVRRFGELAAEETGAIVLSSRCYERESVPYKAFDGIVDQLSRVLVRTSAMDLHEILPRRAALLAQAFPVLRRVRPFADAAAPADEPPLDPKERRAQLFAAVRELLRNLANHLPLVLIIDDLQWSDADSLFLLRDLLRPPDAPGVLLLATARAAGEKALSDIFGAIGEVRQLRLDRLDVDDARRLARKLLDRVPWGGTDMAERIAREADGHPLFIDELVRHALQGGEEQAKTARLEDALAARIERLDEAQRHVLEAVAVAGGPLRLDVVAHATSMELAVLARAASRLRIANLARATGIRRVDLLDTYHDRVRGAVLSRVGEDLKRTVHRRIAMAIEAYAPSDVDALVTHWNGAQDAGKASRYALLAAAHASDAFAFDRAARMYTFALSRQEGKEPGEALGADEERAIRTSLAIALVNAGRGTEAAEVFLAAAEGASHDASIDLRRRAAEQLLASGHFDRGIEILHDVLGAMGMEVPRTHRSALASLLVRRGQLRLRGLDFKEKAESACSPEDLRTLDMLAAISGSMGMVDTVRGSDFQTRHALLALKTGEPRRVLRALTLEASYSATGGTRTAQRTARIVANVRDLGDRFSDEPLAQGWALSGQGIPAFLEGRWKEAYELCAAAATVLRERCAGQAFALDSVSFYSLGALMHLGELKELGRRIPALLDEAVQRGDRYAMTQLRSGVLSIAWLARGDPAGARREADDAITHWSKRGTHLPHFLDVLAQGQIDLYEGRPRAAYARVCDRWPALEKAFLLRVQFIRVKMLELRGRAALSVACTAASDTEAYLREAERCAADIATEETRWGAPLGTLLRASALAARGTSAEVASLLALADAGFTAEHMSLHAAVTRARLAECIERTDPERAASLRAAAAAWMQAQAIADPERMTQTIAPWKKSSGDGQSARPPRI